MVADSKSRPLARVDERLWRDMWHGEQARGYNIIAGRATYGNHF